MSWLKDRAWQQGVAILFVIAGAALIYLGASGEGTLDATATAGVVLFATGIALPLLLQALGTRKVGDGKSDEGKGDE